MKLSCDGIFKGVPRRLHDKKLNQYRIKLKTPSENKNDKGVVRRVGTVLRQVHETRKLCFDLNSKLLTLIEFVSKKLIFSWNFFKFSLTNFPLYTCHNSKQPQRLKHFFLNSIWCETFKMINVAKNNIKATDNANYIVFIQSINWSCLMLEYLTL